jgi:hypothetical protein
MERLSRPVRRIIAVGLLLVVVAVVASLTVVPFVQRVSALSEQIEEERLALGRFAAVVARQGDVADLDRMGRSAAESGAYLPGNSEPVRAAGLQTLLSQLAAANGVRPYSTRTLAARERDDVRLVGVRVQFNADIEQVRVLLHRIESHQPFLFLEAVQIAPVSPYSQRDPSQTGVLDVRLDVYGAVPRQKS